MSIESEGYKPPKTEAERRYSKNKIDAGVDFARSLIDKGILSSGELNAIVAAHIHLKEGKSSERDSNLLTEWADEAESAKMQEQNDTELRQIMVQEVGRDVLKRAEHSSSGIDTSIKSHLLAAKEQNPTDVERVLKLWSEFSYNLDARLMSENRRDPQKVEVALKLANALLQPETNDDGKKSAKEGIEELKKLYSTLR